ncbi:MAG TPA: alpha-mannosidase, partial [Lachnospiraceae bacterium]|nr:alpha-mannosidase [Lachnospiraceae bacterium]
MIFIKERIGKLLCDIKELIYVSDIPIKTYRMIQSEERFENIADLNTDAWTEITNEQLWGGHRAYFWFETMIAIPEALDGKCVVYELKTGREGEWDATNPQFTIYINGIRRQGMDVNHREVLLAESAKAGE